MNANFSVYVLLLCREIKQFTYNKPLLRYADVVFISHTMLSLFLSPVSSYFDSSSGLFLTTLSLILSF